jgi:hypothetical protein
VPKCIAGETTIKMINEEVGIPKRHVTHKKCVIKEKLRCDTSDIQIQNLVHIQDLCTIQKSNEKIPYIDSKRISLMGHFLWDMRSCPKM